MTFAGLEAQGLSLGLAKAVLAAKDQHAGRPGMLLRGARFNALSAGRRTTKGRD